MEKLKSSGEKARLERLTSADLLDTIPEKEFDDIVAIATQVCATPCALISLVDEKRQWFKACVGLEVKETPRDIAFCDYTIRSHEVFVVNDATLDSRFKNNPLVTGSPRIRFYAGVPLWTTDGYCLGSLCVIDFVARELTEKQIAALSALARQVMAQVEARSSKAETLLDHMELKRLRTRLDELQNSMPVAIYTLDREGRCTSVNREWTELTGLTSEQAVGWGWMQKILEEDRIEISRASRAARASGAPLDLTYRAWSPNGTIRVCRAISRADGHGGRIGCIIDVTIESERIAELERQLEPMLKLAE